MVDKQNIEAAKSVLETSAKEATKILGDPAKVDEILESVKAQAGNLPGEAVSALSNIPLMISMVKGYITKQYTDVSPKVVASVLGSLLYLVKGKDLIPDSIPIVGLLDDVAVVAFAMKLNETELDAFKAWQDDQPKIVDAK